MLSYDTILPTDGSKPAIHILVLHGLGDSKEGWKPLAPEFGIADAGWIFVQAPNPYYDGFSWFRIPGMTDPTHGPEDMKADIITSRGLLTELIDHLVATEGVTRDRLILMGFSQGCCMVMDQTLRSEVLFAGTIGISGFIGNFADYPEALSSKAPEQTILMTHGLMDPMLPIDGTRQQAQKLKEMGIPVDWREYMKEHSVDPLRELPDLRDWIRARFEAE